MEVVKEKRTDIQFLHLKGRIDNSNSQALEDNLLKVIEDGARQLIVDCSQIEYLNNAGLRALLNVARRILDVEGRIAFHSPSQQAKDIFDQTGFSMVSRIYDTREEAIAGVAGSGVLSTSRDDRRLVSR